MSVRNQLKLIIGGLGARRAPAQGAGGSAVREFLDRSRVVAVLIFVATVAAIVVISSAGMRTLGLPVQPGEISPERIVAREPFTYVSTEKTGAALQDLADRVPPVYRIDLEPLGQFEGAARTLLARLSEFELAHPGRSWRTEEGRRALASLADRFNADGPYRVGADDLEALLSLGDAAARQSAFESALAVLHEIYDQGVHDASLAGGGGPEGGAVFETARPDGAISARPVRSLGDALTFLRVSLDADGLPRAGGQALFRFFRTGVAPNLVFDADATRKRLAAAQATMKPVTVNVARGQVMIDAGERVTPEEFEMFTRHQEVVRLHGETGLARNLVLFGHVLLVLAMVVASILYVRLEDPETLRSNVRLGLLALVVIVNLALVRAVYSLGGAEFFFRNGPWASTLPYVAPAALAPLIVAILIDAGSAIFMALFISIFTGVIYGGRLDLLVLTFLASLVAIFLCRDARRRGKVVRAAGAGGLTLAAFAALNGFATQTPWGTVGREMAAALSSGLLTGVAVAGLLPVLEAVFGRTTDITLLELTDYNHPLLRRMQLEAPGTYHHSLVVAQLAENACNAIGANPLVARVCALFHDIGKTANPGWFTENQRNRANPHDRKDPLSSARIILQHVPDGVALALRHRLPRAVVDVIRQHHGTGLVRTFHQRAVAAARAAAGPSEPQPVPEAPFRYEGPRPQFKESAVISLADGVEAASRSLRSATPEQLGQLIEGVIAYRISDGQLNEAPLTLEDIARVKGSFTFTLLNMLHARVAGEEAAAPEARHGREAKAEP